MIDLIVIILAGTVILFLLFCCFLVAKLLDEEMSMYTYEIEIEEDKERK